MGQPISEAKKADLLKRAEARLNFALNLPAARPGSQDQSGGEGDKERPRIEDGQRAKGKEARSMI